jgi:hypothetical protein
LPRSAHFTAGLLSTLDLILGVELDEIEERLRVDRELASAAFRGTTPVGELVGQVAAHQRAVGRGLPPAPELDHLGLVAAMAFCWATGYVTAMDQREAAAGPRPVGAR